VSPRKSDNLQREERDQDNLQEMTRRLSHNQGRVPRTDESVFSNVSEITGINTAEYTTAEYTVDSTVQKTQKGPYEQYILDDPDIEENRLVGEAQSTVMGMVRNFRESIEKTVNTHYEKYNQGYSGEEELTNNNEFSPPRKKTVNDSKLGVYELPDREKVMSTGFILGRTSFLSMFQKRWRQLVWVRYTRTTLLFFRSMEDYEYWLGDSGIDPEHREELVKLKIDFVEECSKPEVEGFYVTEPRLKHYEVGDSNLYQFKVDKWLIAGPSVGPNIVCALASVDEHETEAVRQAILGCVRAIPNSSGGEYKKFSLNPEHDKVDAEKLFVKAAGLLS